MTIRRGEPWGTAAPLPEGAPVAAGNSELRALVSAQQSGAGQHTPIGVTGGDLWQVAGAPTGGLERLRSSAAQTVPLDVISVTADGQQMWACAHVIARRSWWAGPALAAMNTDTANRWRLAPAAHPNDGRLQLLTTGIDGPAMSFAQRMLARGRLRSGSHLPHEAIALRRVAGAEFDFEPNAGRGLGLWLDGERVGRCTRLELVLVTDAATVVF